MALAKKRFKLFPRSPFTPFNLPTTEPIFTARLQRATTTQEDKRKMDIVSSLNRECYTWDIKRSATMPSYQSKQDLCVCPNWLVEGSTMEWGCRSCLRSAPILQEEPRGRNNSMRCYNPWNIRPRVHSPTIYCIPPHLVLRHGHVK